jgi:hypothetical protein
MCRRAHGYHVQSLSTSTVNSPNQKHSFPSIHSTTSNQLAYQLRRTARCQSELPLHSTLLSIKALKAPDVRRRAATSGALPTLASARIVGYPPTLELYATFGLILCIDQGRASWAQFTRSARRATDWSSSRDGLVSMFGFISPGRVLSMVWKY